MSQKVNKIKTQDRDLNEASGILEGPVRDGGVDMVGWLVVFVVTVVVGMAIFTAGVLVGRAWG